MSPPETFQKELEKTWKDIASTAAKTSWNKADTAAQNMAPGQGNTMPVKS